MPKYLLASICLLLLFNYSIAQHKITGTVVSEANQTLSGATVTLKNSTVSTITGIDGSFTLNAKKGDMLEFSFIGYKTQQIKIANESAIKVSLQLAMNSLDEVVVTGYTSQKIKAITGSVAVVKPKDLVATPAGQIEQMLQGRVAGLNVITSGEPGGPSNVRIHGIGNFGDVTPLYIIDGVQGNINNVNPYDVESLQVLKDAGAYSIYGVRGANGVIVITTRSGKPGKAKINYDFYLGITEPVKKPDLLNPGEMADLTWLAYQNSGLTPGDKFYGFGPKPVLPDYFIAGANEGLAYNDPRADPDLNNIDIFKAPIYQVIESNKKGTNWVNEVFQPAFSQSHNISVSGANEKNKYLVSFGYLNQQGTALNTYLKRYTARINTVIAVNENIRVGENLQLTHRDNPILQRNAFASPDNDIFRSIISPPILPVYDVKGGWAHYQQPAYFAENPVATRVIAKDDQSKSWETSGNAFGEVDFLKFFTARTSFGGNMVNYYSYTFNYWSYDTLSNGLPDNSFIESSGYRRSWTWTNTVKFAKTIRDDHTINALVGTEAIDNYNREVGGRRIGFFTNNVSYRFLTNGSPDKQSNYSFAGESTIFSFFGQADYSYRQKYFFRGTLRRDGSSVFGPDNRYGWFPSISAAWRLTEEEFLMHTGWLNELKLRASWGKTGFYGNTDPFNQYTLYGGTVADAYYDINGANAPVQGFRAVRLGDPNTGWQEDEVSNIGLESVFFDNKLSLTVDWYNKKANGLLFPITLPDILGGATSPNVNVGTVQNTGVDILLGTKGQLSHSWRWESTVTISKYNNKIVKLGSLNYFPAPNAFFVRNEVGHATGSFYGHKVIGIFQDAAEVAGAPPQDEAKPGRFRYMDANNDKRISDEDRVFIGNPNPDFTAGINISFGYKNFDLTGFFYGSFGNDVVNVTRYITDFFRNGKDAKRKALLYDSWTPQNPGASLPMAELSSNYSNSESFNSSVIEDGSYFRNKSLILGYTLQNKQWNKFKLDKLRVYLQAVNLFTISDYSGLDAEIPGNSAAFGVDFGNYPNNQKQFLLGMSISF